MTDNVIIQEEENYILVKVSGDRIPGQETEIMTNVWIRVMKMCHEKSIHKILAILNLTGRLPTMKVYYGAKNPDAVGWSRKFQLAVVDLNEQSRQDNVFAATVASNRGFPVKIFDNEEDARNWLFNTGE